MGPPTYIGFETIKYSKCGDIVNATVVNSANCCVLFYTKRCWRVNTELLCMNKLLSILVLSILFNWPMRLLLRSFYVLRCSVGARQRWQKGMDLEEAASPSWPSPRTLCPVRPNVDGLGEQLRSGDEATERCCVPRTSWEYDIEEFWDTGSKERKQQNAAKTI